MNVTVVGCGYVGLVTAACLAEVGNRVLCVERDAAKVRQLERGEPGFYEPGLRGLLQDNIAARRLSFSVDLVDGMRHAHIVFIAVNTPMSETGAADISGVLEVADGIASRLRDGFHLVAIKSTVPPGTTERVRRRLQARLAQDDVSVELAVANNPEFLREGSAVEDFMRPDRIIVGCDDRRAIALLRELYYPFSRNHDRFIEMDALAAELTKYAANAMLAARISMMNEFANIAERIGADIEQVRIGVGADHRIGYQYLYPGCGYGGSCLPKDVAALLHVARRQGYEAPLLQAVAQVNDAQRKRLLEKIDACFPAGIRGLRFAVWGLAFKAGTDDLRAAPSHTILQGLWQRGAKVAASDPVVTGSGPWEERDDFRYHRDPYRALEGADALVILTEWKEYRSPDFTRMKKLLRQAVIFDGRNLYRPEALAEMGIAYYAIGRGLTRFVT